MPEVIRQTLYIDMYQVGIEVAVNQIVNVVQGNSSFTPQHVGFSNLTARLERRPSQPRTANAASRAVVVTRIPSICTGLTTVGPAGSTVSPPPREEIARECQKRIENYKELQKKIDKTVANALDQAPWTQEQKK